MTWTDLENVLIDLVTVPHHLEGILQLEKLLLHAEIISLLLTGVTHSPGLEVT